MVADESQHLSETAHQDGVNAEPADGAVVVDTDDREDYVDHNEILQNILDPLTLAVRVVAVVSVFAA